MSVHTNYIEVATKGRRDVVDLSRQLVEIVAGTGVQDGVVIVFVPGSTAALTTVEYEPGLVKDLDAFLERLLPHRAEYAHHDTWHDDNGAAHLQAAVMGPSLAIPLVNGELALGTWQQPVLVDCDTRPRKRRLVVQVIC
ncbi:MAG: secondary thiamine-phosphate synthase enzyme YjbQ [Spirochaetes bacterium]|jgi:secondary thiamine-phosphate synthase enzyme|nr:secondary thiamine-phosphate synthase enzyme YjbQ [Spirochaetota bacterium]